MKYIEWLKQLNEEEISQFLAELTPDITMLNIALSHTEKGYTPPFIVKDKEKWLRHLSKDIPDRFLFKRAASLNSDK